MCIKAIGGTHTDWTSELRSFAQANMKLQLLYHRGVYEITHCAGSAISAFYASTASLVQWLGLHSNAQQDLANLATFWARGQDMSNPDSWTASILTALKCAHALLLAVYECIEWGPAAGPASMHTSLAVAGLANTQRWHLSQQTSPSANVAGFTSIIYVFMRVIREKADTIAVRRRSRLTAVILPLIRVSA